MSIGSKYRIRARRLFRSYFRVAILIITLSSLLEGQARDRIVLRYRATESTIAALTNSGVLYASLDDLAERLGFPLFKATAQKKIEVRVGQTRLKFTAGNPFVVVIDHRTNTVERVHQMPVGIIAQDERYFAPMAMLAPLLRSVSPHALSFQPEIPALFVDAQDTVVAASRASVQSRQAQTTSLVPAALPSGASEPRSDRNASQAAADTVGERQTEGRLAPREAELEAASRYDITRVTLDSRRNGTLVRIHSGKPLQGFRKEIESGVLKIIVPDATVDQPEIRQTAIAGGDVRSVTARQNGTEAIIELELSDRVTTHMLARDVESNDLMATVYRSADVETVFNEEQQDKKKSDRKRSKWNLDCIVIDAGHGGKDPGAIGVNGVKEKNVTLGIALKLGEMIESSMNGVRVVYTRKDDRFIELDQRGKIANEAEGKLFISIHCNSTEQKPTTVHGAEVYLLRPGRTAEAIRVAEFENSVVKFEKDYQKRYQKLTDENFIIVTMAQSAYMKYSERFAELFHLRVKGSKKLKSLGVKQAGFYVLVGASMPSVLIESGFISNIKEEAFLASQAGQAHVAALIHEAVETFAKEYQKSLSE